MAFPKRVHDPQARLDYPMDWTKWLLGVEDIIIAAQVTAAAGSLPGSADVLIEAVDVTDTAVIAWISGGSPGSKYDVTYHIETATGREDDRSLTLDCKER